jgi:predicted PurR-regulated permease PerM
MPDYLVLVSTLGGLALVGVTGLVLGPVIAALFIACWDMYAEDHTSRNPNPSALDARPPDNTPPSES